MNNIIKMSVAAAVLMTVGTVSAQADDGINIFENIKVKGEIRPRYEMVDSDASNTNNANALTNRLVLGVGADIAGLDWLSVYGEMTDVHNVNDNYNSTDNGGGTAYTNTWLPNGNKNAVVADPEQTRLTQAYVDIKAAGALLRSGRQLINLDNQRFVGAVGWRQMPQTFDGFLANYSGIENLSVSAVYVSQVNTIKAGASDSADTETALFNVSYKVADWMKAVGYGYLIGSTSDTYGLALTGKPKLGDNLTVNYRAEFAVQKDATMETNSDGKPDNDSQYYNLELGVNFSGFLAGVNYEVQAADDDNSDIGAAAGTNKAFSTPLGTNHKFGGWADMFLKTPGNGLEDLNVMVGYKSKQLGVFKAIYHDFQAEDGGDDYGSEIDLLYKRAIPGVKGLTGMLKYADYDADDYKADTKKFWVMLDYKFSN